MWNSFASVVVSYSNGVKKGVLSFLSFFVGKLISATFLCMTAAVVSRQFISQDGYIGSFNLRLTAQFAMSGIGAVLTVRWLLELKKSIIPAVTATTVESKRAKQASCPCCALD
ncbi:hypothetical protein [Anaerotruncus colihominis]|uniref:Uncharacterized protein n=1 Tax=Anaerotruncus colihominis TaxID=169435 RepID=A0A845STX3_9FIRM|nr:hypothetical protein [Anaerotruncus colihominis]NDO39285.1 hypothetical protein [Anaerotruncus colihominis]